MKESFAFMLGMLAMGVMLFVPAFASGAAPSELASNVLHWVGQAEDPPTGSTMLDRIHQCLVQAVSVQYQYSNE